MAGSLLYCWRDICKKLKAGARKQVCIECARGVEPMSNGLNRLNIIDLLLGSLPTRSQLVKLDKAAANLPNRWTIRVDRTMPFEIIDKLLPPFIELSQASVQF